MERETPVTMEAESNSATIDDDINLAREHQFKGRVADTRLIDSLRGVDKQLIKKMNDYGIYTVKVLQNLIIISGTSIGTYTQSLPTRWRHRRRHH